MMAISTPSRSERSTGRPRGRPRGSYRDREPVEGYACEGQRLVRILVQHRGVEEIARKARTGVPGVTHWTTGYRRPNADARMQLLKHYDIPLEAWEVMKKTAAPSTIRTAPTANGCTPTASPASPAPHIPKGIPAKDLAHEQLIAIRGRIVKLETVGGSPRELAALENSYTSAVRLYARLSGELEITESALMRSTVWIKAMRLLNDVLTRFPEAAKQVAQAFEDFGKVG